MAGLGRESHTEAEVDGWHPPFDDNEREESCLCYSFESLYRMSDTVLEREGLIRKS